MKKFYFTICLFLITFCHTFVEAGRLDAVATYNKSKSGTNDTVLYVICGIAAALVGAILYFVITKKK